MEHVDTVLYVLAALLQLAAMAYAIRVARDVSDKRPWLVLFAALFVMFGFRVLALFVSPQVRQHLTPWLSVPISFLMFVALFFVRQVALAERQSKAIADRRTAERDESENRYRSLVDLSPDVIFVHAGGKIAYVNAAAVRFFRAKDASELIGRSPLELVAPPSRPLVESRIGQLTAIGQTLTPVAQQWVRLDGSPVSVEVAGAMVPWRGGKGIQSILRDISDRQRAEMERTVLLASEHSARTAAEHASQMKDEFLATLSHELRTPLNAMLGWSQILRRAPATPADLEQGLATIERNARMQTQLIDDLLDMSRIIAGKLRMDMQQLAPETFIHAAMATVQPSADAKGVRLESTIDPAAGPVRGDANRLQQVVWNLLSNAVKFTPKGGEVHLRLQRVGSQVELAVADTGQGIGADFLPYVFDRFRQADATTTRRHGGLGIGLAIVKHLVELHGGTIRADSAGTAQGATFTVALPIAAIRAEADHRGGYRSIEATCADSDIDLSGVKVLAVDDEPDARHLIKRVLDQCHAEVTTASSARMALDMIEAVRPDVLISDVGMPDMDGYELLRRVRAMDATRGGKVPAIALTAFARSEDRTRALMAGYSVHVAKPVEPLELAATVAALAGRTG
jgi:PAS domain S-box-containing protein